MKYRSTRSNGNDNIYSFEDVLFSPGKYLNPPFLCFFLMINHVIHSLLGYANDGGLYVCEQIPQVSKSELNLWKDMTYPCVVKKILRLFIGENELTDIEIEGAFYKIVCWIYIARVIVKLLYISYNHRNCSNFLSRV